MVLLSWYRTTFFCPPSQLFSSCNTEVITLSKKHLSPPQSHMCPLHVKSNTSPTFICIWKLKIFNKPLFGWIFCYSQLKCSRIDKKWVCDFRGSCVNAEKKMWTKWCVYTKKDPAFILILCTSWSINVLIIFLLRKKPSSSTVSGLI